MHRNKMPIPSAQPSDTGILHKLAERDLAVRLTDNKNNFLSVVK